MAYEIDVESLRSVTNRIFDHIVRDLGVTSVPIDKSTDLYWAVDPDDWQAMDKRPQQLGVGRLADDLDFVNLELDQNDPPPALLLMHIAPLLQYLGYKIGQ